ncbi:MAG: transporter [Candidatus Levyibacteriota bacterium]
MVLLLACPPAARGQSIEPRSYSNAPIGVNFLIAGFAYAQGGLSFDTSLPLTDAHLRTPTAVLAYARSLDVFGMSGKFDAIVPYGWLSGSALHDGAPLTREVDGFNDPAFRVSVNFYGAPALAAADFEKYRQDLIIGASLQVSVPWGQYDGSRLVNLGMNRWSFKPELGVSKSAGPWTLELAAATTFYTDNDSFYGGNVRSQDPLYSMQGHAIFNFRSGVWTSLDVTRFAGGRTRINDVLNNDLQQNWRVGATAAFPIDARSSLKVYASSGVSARTGNNFDLFGVAWQYRWGAGM